MRGQAGLALPDSDTELVLTTSETLEPDWLVESVDSAVHEYDAASLWWHLRTPVLAASACA